MALQSQRPASRSAPQTRTLTQKESKAALFKHYIGKPSESDWKEIEMLTGKTRKQCADYWRNILMVKLMKVSEPANILCLGRLLISGCPLLQTIEEGA